MFPEMKGERCAFLVGIGMGVPENMTGGALAAFRQADCILGSGRMLDSFRDWGVPLFDAYDPGKMLDFVKGHPAYRKIAVALSGDVGFYSGAKRLLEAFEAEGIRTELIPGISSAAYFCSRLKIAWEDVKLMSVHGRSQNLIAAVKRHFRTFTLLGGKDNVQSLAKGFWSTAWGRDAVCRRTASLSTGADHEGKPGGAKGTELRRPLRGAG